MLPLRGACRAVKCVSNLLENYTMKTYEEIQQEIQERNLSLNEYGIAIDENGNEYRDEEGCILVLIENGVAG